MIAQLFWGLRFKIIYLLLVSTSNIFIQAHKVSKIDNKSLVGVSFPILHVLTSDAGLDDGLSILEMQSLENGIIMKPPKDTVLRIRRKVINCEDKVKILNLKSKVLSALTRGLNFYQEQHDELSEGDRIVLLAMVKSIMDNKHGQLFEKIYKLSSWMNKTCAHKDQELKNEMFCLGFVNFTMSRSEFVNRDNLVHLKIHEWDNEKIGEDPETFWQPLVSECQSALLMNCQVPYVCRRTILDTTPKSQYMLTHQLLQRAFIQTRCKHSNIKIFLNETINQRLCSKMYREAELIAFRKSPMVYRDLFAEQILLCGFLGYHEFFREDWLKLLLSWQSNSSIGCFLMQKEIGQVLFLSPDQPIPRALTKFEQETGMKKSGEWCLPHFSTVAVGALAMFWDFLGSVC